MKKKEKGLVYKITNIKEEPSFSDDSKLSIRYCIKFKPHISIHTLYYTPLEILKLVKQWDQNLILEMDIPTLLGISGITIYYNNNSMTWQYYYTTRSITFTGEISTSGNNLPDFKMFAQLCIQSLLLY